MFRAGGSCVRVLIIVCLVVTMSKSHSLLMTHCSEIITFRKKSNIFVYVNEIFLSWKKMSLLHRIDT